MRGMSDSEIRAFIRKEVEARLNLILTGQSQNSTGQSEDIVNMLPGQPPIPARPTTRPYGFTSRAPKGTTQVTARMGSHPANRLVLGHRDAGAPSLPDEGDSAVYSSGAQIKLLKDRIEQLVSSGYGFFVNPTDVKAGKEGGDTLVSGEKIVEMLEMLLDLLGTHTHITGAPGGPTSPPIEATQFATIKAQYLTTPVILLKDGGRY